MICRGIATNNALSFMISKFLTCARVVKEALRIARASGVDSSQWRSVITFISARFGSLSDLEKEEMSDHRPKDACLALRCNG